MKTLSGTTRNACIALATAKHLPSRASADAGGASLGGDCAGCTRVAARAATWGAGGALVGIRYARTAVAAASIAAAHRIAEAVAPKAFGAGRTDVSARSAIVVVASRVYARIRRGAIRLVTQRRLALIPTRATHARWNRVGDVRRADVSAHIAVLRVRLRVGAGRAAEVRSHAAAV